VGNVLQAIPRMESWASAARKINVESVHFSAFLARDAFVRTNRRAIAIMFVRLSVFLSVSLRRAYIMIPKRDTVYVSSDFSLRLDSPMFWVL